MFKEVIKIIDGGQMSGYKVIDETDQTLWVPDDMGNSNRVMIDEFVADGGTITEETIVKE